MKTLFGMCSVMWPTIAPSQDLPTITPVIDFGKTGGTRPSCNPPRTLYSRVLGSTGSSTVHAQWNPGKSAATRLRSGRPDPLRCPASSLPRFHPFGCCRWSFRRGKTIHINSFCCSRTATQLSAPWRLCSLTGRTPFSLPNDPTSHSPP